ncbi:hypothetical protein A3753_30400 [Sulfitobacter sp. HI0082]|nr:hypothetical protein A3753_30480 [Sulfitobacter sp. HI0082]KZZ27806.1 hypothetical protein A3753_30400 [Sulfitobacter sp. HI0082]
MAILCSYLYFFSDHTIIAYSHTGSFCGRNVAIPRDGKLLAHFDRAVETEKYGTFIVAPLSNNNLSTITVEGNCYICKGDAFGNF